MMWVLSSSAVEICTTPSGLSEGILWDFRKQGLLEPVLDYYKLDALWYMTVDAKLDHRYLNDIEGLENPTSEVLAVWIWQRLKPALPSLSKVVINETCTTGCSYQPEG